MTNAPNFHSDLNGPLILIGVRLVIGALANIVAHHTKIEMRVRPAPAAY
jgi:hypothetical protein